MRAFIKKELPGQISLGNTIHSTSIFLKVPNAHLHVKGTEESCKQRLPAAQQQILLDVTPANPAGTTPWEGLT